MTTEEEITGLAGIHLENSSRQPVQTAVRNVKFRSNPPKVVRFTAETASEITNLKRAGLANTCTEKPASVSRCWNMFYVPKDVIISSKLLAILVIGRFVVNRIDIKDVKGRERQVKFFTHGLDLIVYRSGLDLLFEGAVDLIGLQSLDHIESGIRVFGKVGGSVFHENLADHHLRVAKRCDCSGNDSMRFVSRTNGAKNFYCLRIFQKIQYIFGDCDQYLTNYQNVSEIFKNIF